MTEEENTPKTKVIAAIGKVIALVGTIPKTGYNSHLKYKFSSCEDVMLAIRPALIQSELIVTPCYQEILSIKENLGNNGKSTRYDIRAHYMIRHTSGEGIPFSILAQGIDHQDKGYPKALTMALKYAYIQLFSLPRGADPDQSHFSRPRTPLIMDTYHPKKDKEFIEWCKSYDGYDKVKAYLKSKGRDLDMLDQKSIANFLNAVKEGRWIIPMNSER